MKFVSYILLVMALSSCKSTSEKDLSIYGIQNIDDSTVVYDESDLNEPVKWIVKIKPKYPKKAIKDKLNGMVKIEFIVNDTGAVIYPRVIKSVPEGIFDKEALSAIKKWRFKPTMKNGERIFIRTSQTITFDAYKT